MSYFSWKPYIPVAKRRQHAAQKIARLKKQGHPIEPVTIEGRTITKSFWGKAWCENLERYSDFANRLPRGRAYVRNGSVIDLKITESVVTAMVSGSEIYQVKVGVARVPAAHWSALCRDCAGTIDSLVELLQGRLSKGVMERVCRPGRGLFPSPKDIELSCSCPDWADMCKHVAAVLYGVGARLDTQPGLLFRLRNVDESDLLATGGQEISLVKEATPSDKILEGSDIAALFGLEMSGATTQDVPPSRRQPARAPEKKKTTTPEPRPMKKAVARRKEPTVRRTRPSAAVKTEERYTIPKQKSPPKTAQSKSRSVASKSRSSRTAKVGIKQIHRSANTGKAGVLP